MAFSNDTEMNWHGYSAPADVAELAFYDLDGILSGNAKQYRLHHSAPVVARKVLTMLRCALRYRRDLGAPFTPAALGLHCENAQTKDPGCYSEAEVHGERRIPAQSAAITCGFSVTVHY